MRARTRPGRLSALDRWLIHEAPPAPGSLVVDLGFGESPVTVYELADALRTALGEMSVLGLEREPCRVPAAPWPASVQLATVWPLASTAKVVRAMNVLRGLSAPEAIALQTQLGALLAEGGLLLEGSSDTEGHLLTCHLARRVGSALHFEGLLFFSDLERGYSPWQFRDWLPRDLRRSAQPGTAIHELLSTWAACIERSGARTPRERFEAGLGVVPGLQASAWERTHGYLRWRRSSPPVEITRTEVARALHSSE